MTDNTPESKDAVARSAKRHSWVAVLLALLASPFFSMLYLGRARRALAYLGLTILVGGVPLLLAANGYWPKGVDWSLLGFLVRHRRRCRFISDSSASQPGLCGPMVLTVVRPRRCVCTVCVFYHVLPRVSC